MNQSVINSATQAGPCKFQKIPSLNKPAFCAIVRPHFSEPITQQLQHIIVLCFSIKPPSFRHKFPFKKIRHLDLPSQRLILSYQKTRIITIEKLHNFSTNCLPCNIQFSADNKTPPSHCCQAGKSGVLLLERRGFDPHMRESASPKCASIASTLLPCKRPRLCGLQKRGWCFSAQDRRVVKTKSNYTKNKKSLYSFFALTDAKYFCYPSNVPKYVEFSKISILNIINIQ